MVVDTTKMSQERERDREIGGAYQAVQDEEARGDNQFKMKRLSTRE